jgi:hypothetical protein
MNREISIHDSTLDPHPNFSATFPRSVALGLRPVSTGPGVAHPGFDQDDVQVKLGNTRFNNLMATVSSVFSCGHRTEGGVELHAIYASDLEAFLRNGG